MAGVKRKAKQEPAAENETVSLLVLIEVLQKIMHCNMYLNENRQNKLELFSYALSDVFALVYLEPCILLQFHHTKATLK